MFSTRDTKFWLNLDSELHPQLGLPKMWRGTQTEALLTLSFVDDFIGGDG